MLTVVYLLIPTSNHNSAVSSISDPKLYIFWFLHQTTTSHAFYFADEGCISFDSYIKPQLDPAHVRKLLVVYLLIPTSNHNYHYDNKGVKKLYIFWFLHQTTTFLAKWTPEGSCISFDSYIKPQRRWCAACWHLVVYLLIPTSNHNSSSFARPGSLVVYLLIPTSNHN